MAVETLDTILSDANDYYIICKISKELITQIKYEWWKYTIQIQLTQYHSYVNNIENNQIVINISNNSNNMM